MPSKGLARGGRVHPTTGSIRGWASKYSSVSESSLLEEYRTGPRLVPINPFCAKWPAALPKPVYFTIRPTVEKTFVNKTCYWIFIKLQRFVALHLLINCCVDLILDFFLRLPIFSPANFAQKIRKPNFRAATSRQYTHFISHNAKRWCVKLNKTYTHLFLCTK